MLEKLKRDYEELKKRLESYEKRPREESHSHPLQFNYWNWIKEVEEEMR